MKKIFFLLYTGMGTLLLNAQESSNTVNITTTAVPFLRISPDARVGGMGEVSQGLSADANSVFYNAAKIPFSDKKAGIAANYAPWQKETADDMYFSTVSGFYKTGEKEALAVGLRYFSLGNVPLVDYNGNKLMTSKPREFAIDFGYARQLSERLGIGLTGRYIHSSLATGNVNGVDYKAGSAVAADLSLYYQHHTEEGKGWSAGLALTNLGSKIAYTNADNQADFIPASATLGVAYTEVWDADNRIVIAADIKKLLVPATPLNQGEMSEYRSTGVAESWFNSFDNGAFQVGAGLEYRYKELLDLRIGYSTKTYAAGNWQNVSVGAGISLGMAKANLAYLVPTGNKISRSPLSNTIQLGLVFQWDH